MDSNAKNNINTLIGHNTERWLDGIYCYLNTIYNVNRIEYITLIGYNIYYI